MLPVVRASSKASALVLIAFAFASGCGARSGLALGDELEVDGGGRGGSSFAGASAGVGGSEAAGGIGGSGNESGVGGAGGSAGFGGLVDASVPDAPLDACVPAVELCNGRDDDCDGFIDDGLAIVPLGEPVVVRDVQGSTGDCSTCRWALDPSLWVSDGGALVMWHLSFNGQSPQPNLFARKLTKDGTPSGAPFALGAATGRSLHPAPRTADRAMVALCQRVDSRDRAASFGVAPDGSFTDELILRSPPTSQCRSQSDVRALWTGERFVVAWSDPSPPFGVVVDVADASGTSTTGHRIAEGGGFGTRIARGHGEVLLVTTLAQAPPGSTLAFHRLDARGDPIGGPLLVASSDHLAEATLVSTPEGWLAYAWGYAVVVEVRISVAGELLGSTSLAVPDEIHYSLFERPSGYVRVEERYPGMALPAVFEWRREDGSLEAEWTAPAEDPTIAPFVVEHDRITWVAYYTDPETLLHNEVRVRRFGCDASTPVEPCPGADAQFLLDRFVACGDGGRVGQSAGAPGATCADVCCVLGFAGCDHRAAQSGFEACNIAAPMPSGACSDVFQAEWSSQCICVP